MSLMSTKHLDRNDKPARKRLAGTAPHPLCIDQPTGVVHALRGLQCLAVRHWATTVSHEILAMKPSAMIRDRVLVVFSASVEVDVINAFVATLS